MGTPSSLILLVVFTHAARAQFWSGWDGGLLATRNQARNAVGEPPLVWDDDLAQYAQYYANQRQGDCALQHSGGPYGENIFWGGGTSWSPADATNDWVAESRDYDYYTNSCVSGRQCGHYTQIIWSSTTRVGCGRVICYGDSGVFMTCNYDPPGNYVGERPC